MSAPSLPETAPTVGQQLTGAVVGVALVAAGYLVALVTRPPEIREVTPTACTVALEEAAPDLFRVSAELLRATRERGDALGMDEYRVLDAEVRHLQESLDAATVPYRESAAACLTKAAAR